MPAAPKDNNGRVRLRCPHCGAVFPPQDENRCPSCRQVVLIPPAARASREAMRDRAIRLSRDRRDRLWRWRRGAGMAASRRMRFTMGVVAFVVLGVFLPFHYMMRKQSAPDAGLPDETRARHSLGALRTALECFKRDCGRYPTDGEGLVALVQQPSAKGWKGPYVQLLKPDPWRHPYGYACTNGTVTLWSAGPDGIAGTADDLAAPPPDMDYVDATRTNAPVFETMGSDGGVRIRSRE